VAGRNGPRNRFGSGWAVLIRIEPVKGRMAPAQLVDHREFRGHLRSTKAVRYCWDSFRCILILSSAPNVAS
jgi:hypothetical protein